MCYGMGCSYEDTYGNCTWGKGIPFPCEEWEYPEEENEEDEKVMEEPEDEFEFNERTGRNHHGSDY